MSPSCLRMGSKSSRSMPSRSLQVSPQDHCSAAQTASTSFSRLPAAACFVCHLLLTPSKSSGLCHSGVWILVARQSSCVSVSSHTMGFWILSGPWIGFQIWFCVFSFRILCITFALLGQESWPVGLGLRLTGFSQKLSDFSVPFSTNCVTVLDLVHVLGIWQLLSLGVCAQSV